MGTFSKLKAILRHTVVRSLAGWLADCMGESTGGEENWLPLHVALSTLVLLPLIRPT